MEGPGSHDPRPARGLVGLLDADPADRTPTNYPLKGVLGTVTRDGKTYERWQHKPTAQGDARIWFYVDGQTVYVEQVHTKHPNQTK